MHFMNQPHKALLTSGIGLLLTACGLPHDQAMDVSRRGAALAEEIQDAADAS